MEEDERCSSCWSLDRHNLLDAMLGMVGLIESLQELPDRLFDGVPFDFASWMGMEIASTEEGQESFQHFGSRRGGGGFA